MYRILFVSTMPWSVLSTTRNAFYEWSRISSPLNLLQQTSWRSLIWKGFLVQMILKTWSRMSGDARRTGKMYIFLTSRDHYHRRITIRSGQILAIFTAQEDDMSLRICPIHTHAPEVAAHWLFIAGFLIRANTLSAGSHPNSHPSTAKSRSMVL